MLKFQVQQHNVRTCLSNCFLGILQGGRNEQVTAIWGWPLLQVLL